jgi:hypothetical protein
MNQRAFTYFAGLPCGMAVASALIVAVCLCSRQAAAQAPAPEPGHGPTIFGHWRGTSEEDGTLDVSIGSNRQLSYQFSGGTQEHAAGTYRLRGANQILFTPTGGAEKDEETWVYTFDDFGRLKLGMEEDKAEDQETYLLNKVEQ